jgi:bidirectional [NiFe] hydrogenase diaphorase subunit
MSTTQTKPVPAAALKDNREKMLERAMAKHNFSGSALIEILHTAQGLYGYLTPALLQMIARKLKLPPSRVLGVVTFYHFFQLEPKGEHSFVVCTGTACYVAGAKRLLDVLEKRCAKSGGTSPDGKVSVLSARCIGCCGLAPAVIQNGRIVGRIGPQQLERELDDLGVPA